ncbi:MAG: IS5 family transposase [Streptosporangiaceae bacterium]
MISRRAYPTDLSDARWALIEPVLSAWRQARAAAGLGLSEPVRDLREIVNAILYVNRAGCAWQLLPHDFPPYQTVYDYYAKWEKDGTTRAIHDLLRGKVREQAGRSPEPTAAIIDARVVKTSSNAPGTTTGYDAGKRTKGRKQNIATDTLGLLLALVITAASVQDTNGGKDVADQLAAGHPSVTAGWVDGGYKTGFLEHAADVGITFAVVPKDPDQKGFAPLPRRWAVERTFGWLVLHRRLVRDFETLPERSATMIHWAMTDNMSRRLTGESTPTWRDDPDETGEPALT